MKLKDGFYASSHGIGGLMLDMPTKNPKTRKKPKVKVGDMVRCEAEGFIYPFRGYVEQLYNLSLIHISEPTRRTPISYAVFCLKKKNNTNKITSSIKLSIKK